MTKESLKIGEKWRLPLTRLQIEELDKMVDFYSREYRRELPTVVMVEIVGGKNGKRKSTV